MATLEVLGMGCQSCIGLLKNAEEAVRLEGRRDRLEKVTDHNRILVLNPWALPALAIDGKVVVAGRIATPAELRALLNEPAALARKSLTERPS
jgi:small redox-active disulfide protein 2